MTQLVRPAIAVLLGIMTLDFFVNSISPDGAGYIHTIIIGVGSLLLLGKWKIHPAYVIAGALVYGAIFL